MCALVTGVQTFALPICKSRLYALIEIIHPDDAAEFRDSLGRCLITGEPFSMSYRLRRADGVYRWMSGRAEPMRDQDGRIIQWYGLCHDIDDQTRLYRDIAERERSEEHTSELQSLMSTSYAV